MQCGHRKAFAPSTAFPLGGGRILLRELTAPGEPEPSHANSGLGCGDWQWPHNALSFGDECLASSLVSDVAII